MRERDPFEPQERGPRPYLLEVEEEADPSSAPFVDDVIDPPQGRAMLAAGQIATVRASGAWRFAAWAFGALFTFWLSVSAWRFVEDLLARQPLLGAIAASLVGLALVAALVVAFREWAAVARLSRLDGFRAHADAALASGDLAGARRVTRNLARLYAKRPDTAWGRARLAEHEADVMDADALLALAESTLLAPLDARAQAEVESAAGRVALVTAFVPIALADVAVALVTNLRMIRRIAEIYGGRSGSIGSLGLMRRVFTALLATGAVALMDDLVGSLAGGGLASKLSRRFGEGVVNGALTARIGLAAMELCRPLSFNSVSRPSTSTVVGRALTGFIPRGARD
ncbi:TIGR01620 family protein [Xinfangfangia sp. CPCC 101601]|uniref:TIGR01620 family protein n=1 Tax=Pseudogemmobacter lacusdianii TaxID=3069608 RepID=A0ABU0VUU1_9RHOB|nr:TIGR01620 family protein [Xinfangfangia sp. CPCC 101601]MDQ2064755.1 TIGR01620 family protein [Xinfangfangia sp. CPCC 101601]